MVLSAVETCRLGLMRALAMLALKAASLMLLWDLSQQQAKPTTEAQEQEQESWLAPVLTRTVELKRRRRLTIPRSQAACSLPAPSGR